MPDPDKIKKFGSFRDYFKGPVKKRGTRQQRGVTGMNRKSQNLVPDIHKVDPTLNQNVEKVRNGKIKRQPVNKIDLRYILTTYNIRELSTHTTPRNAKKLGSTGIFIYFDKNINGYVIEK